MAAHLGVQIASYLLARSTIQTAVVTSTGLGLNFGYADTFRHAACELQLGGLRLDPPVLDMSLFMIDEKKSDSYKKKFDGWSKNIGERFAYLRDRQDLQVDLVLTPIDGATALKDGESGSVSVAAAAPRATLELPSFCNPAENATGYLVIAVGPEQVKALNLGDDKLEINESSLADVFKGKFPLLKTILERDASGAEADDLLVLGLMFDGTYDGFKPDLPKMQSRRCLTGSAVAAALA